MSKNDPNDLAEIVDINEKHYYIHPLDFSKPTIFSWSIKQLEENSDFLLKQEPNDVLKELCSR